MGEVESNYDGLILGLVVGGSEPKSERILDIYSFWRGQNQPGTTPLGIGGPVYGQLPNGEVIRRLSILGKLCRGKFHDEVCQDLPLCRTPSARLPTSSIFPRSLVYVAPISSGILLGFRWYVLGSKGGVSGLWLSMPGLVSPSLDTSPLLISELGCSNRLGAALGLCL